MDQVLLYSDRLIIRTLEERDWPEFRALHQDAEVSRFIREVESDSEIKARFDDRLASWSFESERWLTLVIETLDGEFVGLTGFCCVDAFSRRAEVGYIIKPSMQKQGYGTESLQAVIDWGCLQHQVHKYIGHCAVANIGSIRTMQKCGFQQEGLLRRNYRIGDTWVDEYLMGLLADER
ncbi:GNAT family N-acetyltransferase [Shewanella submarina]|uniref:GNAT family N-acetyltransferase n=1 Tax=Shewanella submarina TaxID=2016376 RepID=A0ABV7G8Y3_9GAMM|nr:GNAT family N-acetyltransferase [Shewanella submarina]MCL1036643.1 GNAT family N-acetyltransferase [Shewanella submarina]